MSEVTQDSSEEFFRPGKVLDPDLPLGEPTSTQWTDEKHSLFLNFMEASFVKQLHRFDGAGDTQSSLSTGKGLGPTPSMSNFSGCFSSGQFKVQRSGYWQKLNFESGQESGQTQLDAGDEFHVVLASPWVRHFRAPSNGKCQELTLQNQHENDTVVGARTRLGWKKHGIPIHTVASSPKLLPTIHRQNSDNQNTEVTDQNFVAERCRCGGAQVSSTCKKKRARTADPPGEDQVVPSGGTRPLITIDGGIK